MAVVTPPTITALPTAPDPNDRATFNARAYPWSAALATMTTEVSAVATNVAANATDAQANAATATAQAALTAADRTQTGLDRASVAGDATSILTMDKRYLGSKATAPTLDNQGATLGSGAVYYDTVLAKVRTWNGVAWVEGISSISGVSSVNGATGDVVIAGTAEIITPANVSPANAATAVTETPALTASAYFSLYSAAQSAIQVQVHTSNVFTSPLYSSGDQAAGISFTLPAAILSVSTVYYWRLRYKNSRGTYSDWSTAFSFTTDAAFNNYIATPAATPAAMGDAFEGGFYTGLMWNELQQSATSTVIGTGSKAFTVPSMVGATIVYSGQSLEVRSRANPANKMIGTVTGANGTTLTINVTSVGGSGTFTDWSIMARYRVIVAPKSSGENASIAYKNAETAAPSATGTLTEGRKATLAMVAADTATVYPAAHWCNNLSIGSRTDWYLPARDELELAWRNLKPTADNNYSTADRATGATPNYANLGSYGDTSASTGLNNNSSPTGAAYTAGSPAQVASGKNFRTSESEAFEYGTANYWSASEYSTALALVQYWTSSFPGRQVTATKALAYRVRAFRRSII